MAKLTLTIDCTDPDRMVSFWTEALGYVPLAGAAQYRSIKPGPEPRFQRGPKIVFQGVPEPKVGKNRLHLDLDLDPGQSLADEVVRLAALGAAALGTVEEMGLIWTTMTDPEGNEFCVVAKA